MSLGLRLVASCMFKGYNSLYKTTRPSPPTAALAPYLLVLNARQSGASLHSTKAKALQEIEQISTTDIVMVCAHCGSRIRTLHTDSLKILHALQRGHLALADFGDSTRSRRTPCPPLIAAATDIPCTRYGDPNALAFVLTLLSIVRQGERPDWQGIGRSIREKLREAKARLAAGRWSSLACPLGKDLLERRKAHERMS